jgi:hypothetical protein
MGFALPQTADRAAPGFPSVRDPLGPQWLLTNQNRPTGSEVVCGSRRLARGGSLRLGQMAGQSEPHL